MAMLKEINISVNVYKLILLILIITYNVLLIKENSCNLILI